MATGSQNLTTYYAKRIIGDTAAASAEKALLQIGTNVNTDTWILHKTGRATNYGIKYHYDYTNGTAGDADQVQFVGKGSLTAWVRLDTGDLYILGKVGIGYDPTISGNTYKLYINGTMYVSGATTHAATVTFANNTLNAMGDDCYIGDQNSGGAICIKGITGNTNIRFIEKDGTAAGTLTWDGSAFTISHQLTTSGGLISPWIELISATPFIDFHFGSSTADYTSRIIESSSGYLQISGKLGIGGSSTDYRLYVNGNTLHNGIIYLANGTTYYINNSGTANLYGLTANSTALFKSTLRVQNSATYPQIEFYSSDTTGSYGALMYMYMPTTNNIHRMDHIAFRENSYNSTSGAAITSYYEDYNLPSVNADRTTSASYNILTTKATVTTAQGGTGNTSYTASRLLYTNTATKFASTTITSDGEYLGSVSYLSINTAHQTSYRLRCNGSAYFDGAVSVPSTLTVRAQNTTTEGGEICLAADPNHSSYPAYLDVCNNYFRIHSNGEERFSVNLSSYGTSNFNGLLQITKNSNTVTIGSANTSFCHFSNSADIPFWFNKTIQIDGSCLPYTNKTGGSCGSTSKYWNGVYSYKKMYIVSNESTDDSTYLMFYASDNSTRAQIIWNGNCTNAKDNNNYMKLKTSYGDIRLEPASASVRVAGTLDIHPSTGSYTEGIRIYPTGSWATFMLLGNDKTTTTDTSANSWGVFNNNGNFYITRYGSSSSAADAQRSEFSSVGNQWRLRCYVQAHKAGIYRSGLHIYGPTYGNTAADMASGTAGLFSWNDGGPQITFDTNATPGGGQAGALIYTDHDTAATGASWHFVSNQGDWNVTSKRFHARTSISIGTNLPSTSYNLSVTGTGYFSDNVTIAAGKRIGNSGGALYLGNSGNQSWVYVQDLASQNGADKWALHVGGNAEFYGRMYSPDTRGGKLRMVDNWLGFYQTADAKDNRYGYIQCNVDRMYFRKENGVSSYAFDFNGYIYTNSNIYATGTMYADGTMNAHGIWANRASGERQVGVDYSTTGTLYLYSNGSTKGLYSGSGYRTGSIIYIDSNNTIFYGNRWRTPNLELAEVDANCMGLCTYGQSTAKRLNVGALLVSSAWDDASNVPTNGLYCKGAAVFNGNVTVNKSNTTGAGIILSDDGDIVDNNDGYCSMRFSSGVRVYTANRGGSATITLGSNGTISAGGYIYTTTYVQAVQHMYVNSGHYHMLYNDTWYGVVFNHGNANVSLNACSGGLYIGYSNTTLLDFMHGKGSMNSSGVFSATQVKNAVWNDYAECRSSYTEKPGYCVTETSKGKMALTTSRLQAGCKIISDTYGTLMGETTEAKTPIAVAGRVLVYPYRARKEYTLGAAVCSAPGGMVDIMTRDEVMMYPERIVGTVSEIPTYEIWHGGSKEVPTDIQVNGRIWVYVR